MISDRLRRELHSRLDVHHEVPTVDERENFAAMCQGPTRRLILRDDRIGGREPVRLVPALENCSVTDPLFAIVTPWL